MKGTTPWMSAQIIQRIFHAPIFGAPSAKHRGNLLCRNLLVAIALLAGLSIHQQTHAQNDDPVLNRQLVMQQLDRIRKR